ncbi:MAG TPA: BREX system ATP-binding domain-containing protein, partial [Minicystis sp.]|nr:BREX system ATP-binding domain-containing protein [Minicystis sp.]
LDEIDARIDALFATAANDGSVFAVLMGEYGAGKTHHLLHIEARALAERRPVLWLSIERLDEDLGNPQRHLRRLLEGATLPAAGAPSPVERLDAWLRSEPMRRRLGAALRAVAETDAEAAVAARRALRGEGDAGALDEIAVRETLGALDLVDKPAQPSYRRDAYARLHLWIELLSRIDGCEGPVVLLDEAENLYRLGVSRAERRTALRSLSFYCSGALPRACVVLAVTPASLGELREEAGALLDEIEEQRTLLASEDVVMLKRRLLRARPIEVTRLGKDDLVTLATQARALHEKVRGKVVDPGWDAWLRRAAQSAHGPRDLLRRATLRLERAAWGAPP